MVSYYQGMKMNIIEKTFESVKERIEFYLDNSTLSEQKKDRIRQFIKRIG